MICSGQKIYGSNRVARFLHLKEKPNIFCGLKFLTQIDRKILKFIAAETYFSLDKNGRLVEDDDGVTGTAEFIKMFPNIKFRGETKSREKLITVLKDGYKNNTLFVDDLSHITGSKDTFLRCSTS